MQHLEQVLNFTDKLVYSKTGEHLNDLQIVLLRESWQESKKTYDQIASEYGYSAQYIKQGVAPKLWKLLSKALGEKVSKVNIHSVLERQMALRCNFKAQPIVDAVDATEGLSEIPLPVGKLELPQDSVPLGSAFYVKRVPHEPRCYQELLSPGAFIRIKAPRQMGKTSLMNRMLAYATGKGYQTGLLHFQQAEATVLTDLNRLLRWFCVNLSLQLNFKPRLDDYWDEDLGSKMSCTLYLQGYLLEQIQTPLVLALEEVNEIIVQEKVAQEFLTLLRFWHERTKTDPIWQKLRLVMVHSTEIYIPLDINQSPLNIGLGINLKPFAREQVQDLVKRHGIELNSEQFARLMHLVGGHPYLVRLTLYHLARQETSLEDSIENAATDAGIYSKHLHRHLWNLQQHPSLAVAFQEVLKATEAVELEQIQGFKLHSMGLVNLDGNQVTISCDLYQRYFSDRLSR